MTPIILLLLILVLYNRGRQVHFRDIFETILGKEDAYKCAKWAFGEDFENLTTKCLSERWNDNHPDLFMIRGDGNIIKDIKKIIEEWKIHGRKNEI